MNKERLLEIVKEVLEKEANAIREVKEKVLNSSSLLLSIIEELNSTEGRIIVTGIGKSGIVAQKFTGSLASVGKPALFLHPTEAYHGDIGMVTNKDVVIMISNSGETEEIVGLIPYLKRRGAKLVALVGNSSSAIAKNADISLDIGIREEACPFNLLPTSSVTAALSVCDALVISLLKLANFNIEDFANLHPGGNLGKKLIKIEELMHKGEEIPYVYPDTSLQEALLEMSSKRLGITTVIDKEGILLGLITDGDLRRIFQANQSKDIWQRRVDELMTRSPKTIKKDCLAGIALKKMQDHAITSLMVVEDNNKLIGVIHLHDLLRANVV